MTTTSPTSESSLPASVFTPLLTEPVACVEPISGSGSNRRYWTATYASGRKVICTLGLNKAENEAFFYLDGVLGDLGELGELRVPRILAISEDRMAYVQSYAGSTSLFQHLDREDLIAKAMRLLAQVHSIKDIDWSRCYPVPAMDRRSIFWDLNYFKYCFLKTSPGMELDEPALEDDFERLADRLLKAEPWALMLRDFQSRNLMVSDDGRDLTLIDFQGGRRGPVHYDVASFLWQARAGFSNDLRRRMVSEYCRAAGLDESRFNETLPHVVLFRQLQVLGAYGFRGRFEGKPHFLASIPPAFANINSLAPILARDYPSIFAHLSH